LNPPFERFKDLADKKRKSSIEDLEALIDDQLELTEGLWELVGLQVTAGSKHHPHGDRHPARHHRQTIQDASVGDGPVDAIYSAIQRLTGIKMSLTDYRIRSVTKGKEALGEAHVELEHSGRKIRGRGLSTDVLEASARAYIAAVNRLRSLSNRDKAVTQHTSV